MLKKKIKNYYLELGSQIELLDKKKIYDVCNFLKKKIKQKKKIFVCGNGGSASLSDHFVTDFNQYLKRKSKRKYLPRAISLSNSMSVVTALSNDVGYKNIFIEQIENYYDTGDCIVLFSGSGS